MALVEQSLDEITTTMLDDYDALVQETTMRPLRVWRNNNNKLYLIFRALAGGFKVILDAVLALRYRFDPARCDAQDLYSLCRMTGTSLKEGKGSVLQITIKNINPTPATLPPGVYNYNSVSGMIFSFYVSGVFSPFSPAEAKTVSAVSVEKGAYRVETNSSISVNREDGASIDGAFRFSCVGNQDRLGYFDESEMELRERILTKTNRQDHLKELELKIRNLPDIFECNLVFNAGANTETCDGITLAPKELLIIVTGTPKNEMAIHVASEVLYATHKITSADRPDLALDPATDPDTNPALYTVFYENDLYVDEKYPVYFMPHSKTNFSFEITYQFDSRLMKSVQVEKAIDDVFGVYRNAVRHVDVVSEEILYKMLSTLDLPGVVFRNADVVDDTNTITSYLSIPKTRLPNLTGIHYIVEEVNTQL